MSITDFSIYSSSKKVTSFLDYIQRTINNIKSNEIKYRSNIVYISGPVTGVDDYKSKFEYLEILCTEAYKLKNAYVINPSKLIDQIKENFNDLEYLDIMKFCFKLIDISNILVVDNRTDLWTKSRGVSMEIGYATAKGLNIVGVDYIKDLIEKRKGFMK